jgi:Mn2+/Fe2+ NRAMP family transporter
MQIWRENTIKLLRLNDLRDSIDNWAWDYLFFAVWLNIFVASFVLCILFIVVYRLAKHKHVRWYEWFFFIVAVIICFFSYLFWWD